MSAIKSFFDKTFFLNGTEGIILFLVCIAAAVCTVVVIALAITVIVVIKRRKREGVAEVAEPVQQATPEGQTEQAEAVTEYTPLQVLAETSTEAPEGQAEQAPAVTSAKKVKIASGAAFVAARYDKSFTAKLIQSDDVLKGWYSSLKNALLGYKKVNSRISWHTDSINRGRIKLAKFAIRGKTLRLYLALNPDGYADTKYKVERAESKRYEEVPCLYRIKNARRAKYALELIATLAEKFGLQPVEREQVDYYLPYEENEPLLERGLIKEIVYKPDEPVQVEEDGEIVEEVVNEVAAAEERVETRTVLPFDRNAVQYIRSFTAKLIQSNDEVKGWYAELKNELLSYKKVKSRISWKRESFRLGRKNVVRFAFRGKTLCVYFALNPNEFDGTKYKVEAVEVASYADTSCMYRIKNGRRVRYAKELIAVLMSGLETERTERAAEDYYLPYEDTEPLIEKGLIKVINITSRAQTAAEEEPTGEGELSHEEESVEEAEEAAEEIAEEIAAAEVPDEEPTKENPVEETAEEEQPVEEVEEDSEEQPAEEVEEDSEEQPVEEAEEISEEVAESEPTEEPAIEAEVEELSAEELDDVETYEEKAKDEDGIEVVGVMFRRRGKKVYWFDPDGKTWEKGEIALYKTEEVPPQEVIVVENTKISPEKLHLPLKPLYKAPRLPQTGKK